MTSNLVEFLFILLSLFEAQISLNGERVSNQDGECVYMFKSTISSHGVITSPKYPDPYPNNLYCRYEFYGRQNERVVIQVDDFDLEQPQSTIQDLNLINTADMSSMKLDDNEALSIKSDRKPKTVEDVMTELKKKAIATRQCFYDYLDIFSVDAHSRLFWRSRHCGSDIDTRIVSTSPALVLVFRSDRMLAYRGFKFQYNFSSLNTLPFKNDPICGYTDIFGNGSLLASPHYPNYFPYHVECAWTIEVEQHKNVLIKFVDVNMNQSCQVSFLNIWDGYVNDIGSPDLVVCEKLSYYHKGQLQFKSKSNRVVIRYVTNRLKIKPEMRPDESEDSKKIKENIRQSIISEFLHNKTKLKKTSTDLEAFGFKLSWTGVHVASACKSNEFQCKGGEYCIDSKKLICQVTNKYCISNELVCDDVLNCDVGDNSDEKLCNLRFLHSTTRDDLVRLSIVVGVSIFLTATCMLICVRRSRRRDKPLAESDASNDSIHRKRGSSYRKCDEPHVIRTQYMKMPSSQFIPQEALPRSSSIRNSSSFNISRDPSLPPPIGFIDSDIVDKVNRMKRNSSFSNAVITTKI